jgi:protoporphyrinogen oxidase
LVPVPAIPDYDPEEQLKDSYKVCIVGAGCAGLFTAMIFNHLNAQFPGLNVKYEILEANKETRFGGRLYTHHFSEEKHDYFDVGAMRYPEINIMAQ